jgi:RNA polymerase sigma-70 factor (ECF subfamily)
MERGLPRPLNEQSDEELMVSCRAGRKEALEELFRRYQRPLYQFVYRHLHDREMASDVVQETFLRVYNHRKRYKPTARFSYWLYRIARNLCVDERRRYWNRNVTDASSMTGEDTTTTDYMEMQSTSGPDGADLLQEKEMEQIIRNAIEDLSEEQRQVMIMHKYQGMAYKDIAKVLGITTESVKQRAYRAHVRLREQLQHLLQEKEH